MAPSAARLLRAYATQVEALRRLRNDGSQTVRVEHVHVNEGGQAVTGPGARSAGGPRRGPGVVQRGPPREASSSAVSTVEGGSKWSTDGPPWTTPSPIDRRCRSPFHS